MWFSFDINWFSSAAFTALLASLGFGEPPVDGTLIRTNCTGTTLVQTYADGEGGERQVLVENSLQCGYTPPPEAGTVLDSYCLGYTYWEEIADGEGSYYSTSQEYSQQCGYTAPPPAGTLLKSGCSADYPGVKWFQYADGEGGTYAEKDPKSRECGWEPPTLKLSINSGDEDREDRQIMPDTGDRFTPVVVDVDYKNFLGEPEGWGMEDASSTIGWLQRRGSQIYIWGDGRTGDGTLTLGRTEIQFYMEDEPRCDHEQVNNYGSSVDCMGYRVSRNAKPFRYYGEEDDFVVPWEYTVVEYISHRNEPDITSGIYEEYERDSNTFKKWQRKVDSMNELLEKSGVYIHIVLKKVARAHYHGLGDLERTFRGEETDVVIGWGISNEGTCGIAYPNKIFRQGEPVVGMSKCGWKTDLHELGHAVGLAHGPENQAYAQSGYIWPDFGHGWNDYCGQYDDIMSYGYNDEGFGNSRQICEDQYPNNSRVNGHDPAGHRDYHDSAYHLNRVRYDVSQIHPEYDYVDPRGKPASKPAREDRPERPLITD